AFVESIVVRDNWVEEKTGTEVVVLSKNAQDYVDAELLNESEELRMYATYLDRVLLLLTSSTVISTTNDVRRLYMPVKRNEQGHLDNYHILATLLDGVMLGLFVDIAQPEFLDTRVIHLPNLAEPIPLPLGQIEDNVQLILSSAKALGMRLPTFDPSAWVDPKQNVSVLLALLKDLCDRHLQTYFNVSKHPELIRLAADNEDSEAIGQLTSYHWIPRWMNNLQKRPLHKKIDDFNLEMFNTMAEIDKDFLSRAPVSKYTDNPAAACGYMIDFAIKDWKVVTNIEVQDLLDNNRLLQDLFAAQVFDTNSGLSKLTKKEEKQFQSIHLDTTVQSADDSMCNFINSLLPADLMIHNLKKDLSDGVVVCKILDKVKPGCINWEKVRDKDKVRHKFDKMNNWVFIQIKYAKQGKQAMEVAMRDLNLKMINASGQDLHDGNQKIIHSLLWQIMRFQAMKTLSSLSFGGKPVEEKDILDWCNNTLLQINSNDRHSEAIQGFKDRHLTTCIFYIEILKVILPGAVKDDIVYWDVTPLQDLHKREEDEDMYRKRLANAKYAMTLARREGAELFILPEDLVTLEPKAVLSIMASLMTIGFQKKNSKQNRVK
ncbi:hypothetical protein RFI_27784, partial [Reticulomyxa filosa]